MNRSSGRSPSKKGGDTRPPASGIEAVTIDGWTLLAHPCFLDQVERLLGAVEDAARRDPDRYEHSADFKVLAAIGSLAFDVIPQDPARREYRHGGTLDGGYRHWFRARFGNGRFRLFFRYRADARIIVYAWVNDAETLRTYGSDTDAYAVFARMLGTDHRPDDWDALVAQANEEKTRARTARAGERISKIREW